MDEPGDGQDVGGRGCCDVRVCHGGSGSRPWRGFKIGDMDLTYPPEAEAFRGEIRGWLEEHLPEGWFDDDFSMTPEERTKFHEEWTHQLFDGGWICASWPKEYGGKGLSIMEN